MNITRRLMMIGAALGLAGCAAKIRVYDGSEITRVQVFKEARMMRLLSDSTVMRTYNFELGFAPTEHKKIEGDGRTPEGAYLINRLNPNSRFHLSLGISYPDADDVSYAQSVGKSPGGNIFYPRDTDKLSRQRRLDLGLHRRDQRRDRRDLCDGEYRHYHLHLPLKIAQFKWLLRACG